MGASARTRYTAHACRHTVTVLLLLPLVEEGEEEEALRATTRLQPQMARRPAGVVAFQALLWRAGARAVVKAATAVGPSSVPLLRGSGSANSDSVVLRAGCEWWVLWVSGVSTVSVEE